MSVPTRVHQRWRVHDKTCHRQVPHSDCCADLLKLAALRFDFYSGMVLLLSVIVLSCNVLSCIFSAPVLKTKKWPISTRRTSQKLFRWPWCLTSFWQVSDYSYWQVRDFSGPKLVTDMIYQSRHVNSTQLNSTNHPKRKEWFTRGKKL